MTRTPPATLRASFGGSMCFGATQCCNRPSATISRPWPRSASPLVARGRLGADRRPACGRASPLVGGSGPRYAGGNWNGGNWNGRWHGGRHYRLGGFWPGVGIGLGIGSSYAYYGGGYYDPYYNNGYYDDGYYDDGAVAVVPGGGDDAAYCAQRYRSYDPASGTYLGYDGQRHPCP